MTDDTLIAYCIGNVLGGIGLALMVWWDRNAHRLLQGRFRAPASLSLGIGYTDALIVGCPVINVFAGVWWYVSYRKRRKTSTL